MSHASYLIPIKTVTGLNAREHWRKRAARVKAVRDEIAKINGVDDGPAGPITWVYAQEKCKRGTFGVRVEFLAI